MNICMAGIDYTTADIAVRGRFSLSAGHLAAVLERIYPHLDISGCVVLSTCNRTEVYLSYEGNIPDACAILCEELGFLPEQYRCYFTVRNGHDAVWHLMRVTSGLCSQVRAEDQILTQVKTAIQAAREAKTSGPVLETLFRWAITAAKKVKTQVVLHAVERSIAGAAIQKLQETAGNLHGKTALVVGNGEMGKLAARLLVAQGCAVTVTLRSYKRGVAQVPDDCETISYDRRYEAIYKSEILISATASPHYTIREWELAQISAKPRFMIDLAVPCDIEPAIANDPSVTLWNVDALHNQEDQSETEEKLQKIEEILGESIQKFEQWLHGHLQKYAMHMRA